MNERIKELIKQHGVDITIDGMGYGKGNIEGLAELLIQECALIAFHNVVNLSSIADAEDVEANIKEHFGVEE
jgi:hypothetical protein